MRQKSILCVICLFFTLVLLSCNNTAQDVPKKYYEPTWESLEKYTIPQWYKDAKFGIFIHWGVYSVPAFANEWYPRNMYLKDSGVYKYHLETYGPQKEFGYKDFIPQFNAERWDPYHWAELFKKAGAKYVVPVAEHHDGFAMYNCSHTKWDAVEMGPRRDIIGDLAGAVRKQGLKFGASYHRAHNWNFFTFDDEFDTVDPENSGLYGQRHEPKVPASEEFMEDWLARYIEIIDKYQPDLAWFDFGFNNPEFEPYRKKLAAYYYNKGQDWVKGVVLNYKNKAFPEEAAVLDIERGKLNEIRKLLWQTDTSVCNRSWGYIRNHDYKSVDRLVDELVDIVSKNGCLLLNICPKPDGTIPEPQEKILSDIGRWLEVNGEAIYDTRYWKIYGEGPTKVIEGRFNERNFKPFTSEDIRFTVKDNNLYAICLVWPGEEINIKSLGLASDLCPEKITDVKILGIDQKLKWNRKESGLFIELPDTKPCDYAYAFRISLEK